ncbi:MAG: AI-2E family transporter [Bacteroidota bacterium]
MQATQQSKTILVTAILITICILTYIMRVGQDIIIPLLFSAFFAILLSPVIIFFEDRKMPRILAITVTMILALIVMAGLIYFVSIQVSLFSNSLPDLEKKLEILQEEGVTWVAQNFHLKPENIEHWISDVKTDFMENSSVYIGTTLSTLTGVLAILILLPIYTMMMLYYEPLFIVFVQKAVPEQKHSITKDIITEAKMVMQSYLSGLLIEALIVGILNFAGLLILGIDYAILWAIIGALLNIIPYIGIIIATIFPFTIALITKEPSYAFLVLAVYASIQFIDNNIIVPKIVASRVKINALVSIIIVLIGGSIWGISGMFLSLPLVAVAKIIFDRIPHLKPYGYLIGDVMPAKATFFKRSRNLKTKTPPVKVN